MHSPSFMLSIVSSEKLTKFNNIILSKKSRISDELTKNGIEKISEVFKVRIHFEKDKQNFTHKTWNDISVYFINKKPIKLILLNKFQWNLWVNFLKSYIIFSRLVILLRLFCFLSDIISQIPIPKLSFECVQK